MKTHILVSHFKLTMKRCSFQIDNGADGTFWSADWIFFYFFGNRFLTPFRPLPYIHIHLEKNGYFNVTNSFIYLCRLIKVANIVLWILKANWWVYLLLTTHFSKSFSILFKTAFFPNATYYKTNIFFPSFL